MSTVAEIRDAICRLPPKDAWQLAQELREHLDDLWDKQFEEDVKAGRLDNSLRGRAKNMRAAKTDAESCGGFRAGLRLVDEHAG